MSEILPFMVCIFQYLVTLRRYDATSIVPISLMSQSSKMSLCALRVQPNGKKQAWTRLMRMLQMTFITSETLGPMYVLMETSQVRAGTQVAMS